MNSKSKTALKNIVKECLIEILAEGLVGNNKATLRESRELRGTLQESYEKSSSNIIEHRLRQPTQVTNSRQTESHRASYLDSIKMGIDTASTQKNDLIKKKVKKITNDPIMSDILADTALTTLQEQREGAGASGPSVMAKGDKAAKVVAQSSPEDLFGSKASKWADLAFAPSSLKR